jgi:hypothetical protein
MSLWEDVKQNLVTWYDTAAHKTGEITKVGLRRYDIFGLSREIERQFGEIGNHVYTAVNAGRTEFAGDPVLDGLVKQVRELEQQLSDKEREIEAIRKAAAEEARQKRGAAAAAASAVRPVPAAVPDEKPDDADYVPLDESLDDDDDDEPEEFTS